MPRKPSPVPSYRLHKQSGQAVVTLRDAAGKRRDVLLGTYNTPESLAEYRRVLAEWDASAHRPQPTSAGRPAELTINELAVAFLRHAEQHYRRADGTPTSELEDIKRALRPLCHLYGHTPARDLGPLALKAVRKLMVDGYDHPRHGLQETLCRSVVNQRVNRIRRMFRWGVEEEIVPAVILEGLRAVKGLQRGRTEARETLPVTPVSEAVVDATLPFLLPPVRALVLLQLHTGMRPGEAVVMRACDLDTTGAVWLYRPASHKTEHHGHARVIALGPKAQDVVRPFLKTDLTAYLFSPAEGLAAVRVEKRKARKTKVQPSQVNRRKARPGRVPGPTYSVAAYGRAIASACDRAFPSAAPLARLDGETVEQWQARLTDDQKAELQAWRKAHRWHPHQLRHTAATKLRREYGLDVARVVLGHRSPQITELYAELDVGRAVEAMARLG